MTAPNATPTLGALLARQLSEEAHNTRAAAERAALAQSEKALEEFRQVDAFFQASKAFFIDAITRGVPSQKRFVLVGRPYMGKGDNEQVYHLLRLYESVDPPRITQSNHPYHPLWAEFANWAQAQGLDAKWCYQYDGGGMSSWYELRVTPSAQAQDARHSAWALEDIRQHHGHCLAALQQMSEGFLQATRALNTVSDVKVRKTLKELQPLMALARQVKTLSSP